MVILSEVRGFDLMLTAREQLKYVLKRMSINIHYWGQLILMKPRVVDG